RHDLLGDVQRLQRGQLAALSGEPAVDAVRPAADGGTEAPAAAWIAVRFLEPRAFRFGRPGVSSRQKEFMMVKVVVAAALVGIATLAVEAHRGAPPPGPQKLTAIRAGRVIDPETGTAAANQVIVVEGERIRDIG